MKPTAAISGPLLVWLGFILVATSHGQTVQNPEGDLAGTNYGDMILLTGRTEGASEDVIYRSLWISGPWEVLHTIVSPPKGSMIDVTPDAMTMSLAIKSTPK